MWRSRACPLRGRWCESSGVRNVRCGASGARRGTLPYLNLRSVLKALGFSRPGQAMSANLQQSQRDLNELDVFSEFSKRSPLNVDEGSIEKRCPPEPDILCRLGDGERVAFELKELCSENIARASSHLLKTGHEQPKYIRDGDSEDYVLKETLGKRYVTEHPIELLFYTDGRIVTPADILISKARECYGNHSHTFRRSDVFGSWAARTSRASVFSQRSTLITLSHLSLPALDYLIPCRRA